MSSAGHILDMIIRMRQNRSIRTSSKQKFRSNNREAAHRDNGAEALRYKMVSMEKLEKIKKGIREKARTEQRILIVTCIVTAVLVIALMLIVFV